MTTTRASLLIRIKDARAALLLACTLQARSAKVFLHPSTASSWARPSYRRLIERPRLKAQAMPVDRFCITPILQWSMRVGVEQGRPRQSGAAISVSTSALNNHIPPI